MMDFTPVKSEQVQSILAQCKYTAEVGIRLNWPNSIQYKGTIYWWMGKQGTDKTGLPSACYRHEEDRVWLRCDGKMTED